MEYNKQWLDFIVKNRMNGGTSEYDIVYDKMADNQYENLSEYIAKYYNNEMEASEVLDLITFLVSELRNISRVEAERLIMSTDTGKAIKLKDESVMYDQDIANLSAVYDELMYEPFQRSNIYILMKEYERECNENNRRKAEQITKKYCKISNKEERYELIYNQKEVYRQKPA